MTEAGRICTQLRLVYFPLLNKTSGLVDHACRFSLDSTLRFSSAVQTFWFSSHSGRISIGVLVNESYRPSRVFDVGVSGGLLRF